MCDLKISFFFFSEISPSTVRNIELIYLYHLTKQVYDKILGTINIYNFEDP